MRKLTIGLPKGIYYYYYGDILKKFFSDLGIHVIVSPDTNRKTIDDGIKYANDEMCLSLKVLLGHINYLKDKCDYIVVPRIVNYGKKDQTCTNFLGFYDMINNLFNVKIITFDIDYQNKKTEKKAFIKVGKQLKINNKHVIEAYQKAYLEHQKKVETAILKNMKNLGKDKIKVLMVAHPYNLYDRYIGQPIIDILQNQGVEIIYSDKFDPQITNKLASCYSKSLYWKYAKENIGAIKFSLERVDGVVFLTTFPCGIDSLVNELVIRKINKPTLNLIIDDNDSLTGIETRLESFVDILEQAR